MTTTVETVENGEVTSVTHERNKVTVSFARKVNLGNFESADASAFVEADVAIGADDAAKTVAATAAAAIAKSVVYETLGIGMTVKNGTVDEAKAALANVFGQTETVEVAPTRAASKPQAAGSPAAGLTGSAAIKARWEHFVAHPELWWDNRNTKTKDTQPDFKLSTSTDDAIWLAFKGASSIPAGFSLPDGPFKQNRKAA